MELAAVIIIIVIVLGLVLRKMYVKPSWKDKIDG